MSGPSRSCDPRHRGSYTAVAALLTRTSTPTDAEIDEIENVCRCGTCLHIRAASRSAAAEIAAREAAGG